MINWQCAVHTSCRVLMTAEMIERVEVKRVRLGIFMFHDCSKAENFVVPVLVDILNGDVAGLFDPLEAGGCCGLTEK